MSSEWTRDVKDGRAQTLHLGLGPLTVRDVKGRCAVSSVASADNVQFLVVQIVNAILTGIGSRRTGHGHGASSAADATDATARMMVVVVMVMVVKAAAHSAAASVVLVRRIVVMPLRRCQHGLPADRNSMINHNN